MKHKRIIIHLGKIKGPLLHCKVEEAYQLPKDWPKDWIMKYNYIHTNRYSAHERPLTSYFWRYHTLRERGATRNQGFKPVRPSSRPHIHGSRLGSRRFSRSQGLACYCLSV